MKAILFLLFSILPFSIFAQIWNHDQKIVASDRAERDNFGSAVSIDDSFAVVGAFAERNETLGTDTLAGAAYVYQLQSDGSWLETQKLVASDRAPYAEFGWSVSISGDYIFIGAARESKNAMGNDSLYYSGAVYIYKRDVNNVWNEVKKLQPNVRSAGAQFGVSVSVDGNQAMVASNAKVDPVAQTGLEQATFFYSLDANGNWVETDRIGPTVTTNYTGYLQCDIKDNRAIVGSPYNQLDTNENNTIVQAGAAFVFEKDGSGKWSFVQKITLDYRTQGDWFGWDVAIENDKILVGVPRKDLSLSQTANTGAVYVYNRSASGYWLQGQQITSSDNNAGDEFGNSVAMRNGQALIGAWYEEHDVNGNSQQIYAGSAYFFREDGSGNFSELKKVVSSTRSAGSRSFGRILDLNEDGSIAIIGSSESTDVNGTNVVLYAGAAHIFSFKLNVGILGNNLSNRFKVYPNPTNEFVLVELGDEYEQIELVLSNINGAHIYNGSYNNQANIKLKMSNYPAGVYLLRLYKNKELKGSVKVQKL